MPSLPPEQRTRALAGQATLLRTRVLEPLDACWTELARALDDDAWRSSASVARRGRQALAIALEHYSARAAAEPMQLDVGEALAELERCVAQLGDATNTAIDALAGLSSASERIAALARELDALVVQLHRWLAELARLDASWRGPAPAPAPPPAPLPALPPALPPARTNPSGPEVGEPDPWPAFVEPCESARAWWSPPSTPANSPWRHTSCRSPS
jgi:hypothetical protein